MSYEGRARFVLIAGAIAILELVCQAGAIARTTMIPPTEMAAALFDILRSGKFTGHIIWTLRNIVVAAVLAMLAGFVIGVVLHAFPRVRRALDPLFASYYALPFFVFYPVLIVLLGLNELPIIALAFFLSVVAMILSTLNGIDRIPRVLNKVARVHRMRAWEAALIIKLPAAAPHLFSGAKLVVAYAFIGVIASEFILSGRGVGYAIAYAYENFDNRTMYGLMLLVIISVTLVNTVLHISEQRLLARRQR